MKKALIFFFLVHFVGHQLFLTEWIKLPALFAHFREHRIEKRSFTDFGSFFQAHYGCSQHKFSEDHSGLPFQDEMACVQNIQLFFNAVRPIRVVQTFPTEKAHVPVYRTSCKSVDACAIWQPPKING